MTILGSIPIIDVASLILAVFLGYLAVREYVGHRTGKLEKELKMVNSALTRERYAFSDKALQMYGVEKHQLLYRDGWVVPFEKEFFYCYANSRKPFTTFREMLRIVSEDFNSIKNHKVEGTVGASFATDLGDGAVEKLA